MIGMTVIRPEFDVARLYICVEPVVTPDEASGEVGRCEAPLYIFCHGDIVGSHSRVLGAWVLSVFVGSAHRVVLCYTHLGVVIWL